MWWPFIQTTHACQGGRLTGQHQQGLGHVPNKLAQVISRLSELRRAAPLPSPPGLRTPPPQKNTITARHTPHHPHTSQRQGKHISTTNTYMARYARVCSTGASRPAVQALPAAYEYPAAQDPTQHAAPERSQAAAQPAHTDAPTNTPQTPRRPVSSLHTHTHTTPTPASPPPRASGCACISLRKPPKQATADLSGHQKRPLNPHASLYRQTGAQARRLTSECQPPARECAGAGLEQAAAPLAVRGQLPAGPRGTRAHSAGGGGARF